MADILIRGMEMPSACFKCEFIEADLDWCRAAKREVENPYADDGLPVFCPLIALPEGHGRLIDADATAELLRSLGSRDYRREKGTICEAEKMVRYPEYTPTIVPAEKEGTSDG